MTTREERKAAACEQKREQILDAALEVFATRGFAAAGTAEIARVAGVAEGTIYNYFRSKREVLIAAIERSVMSQPFAGLIQHAEETDYPTLLTRVLENRLSLLDNESSVRLLMMMSEILRDPELKDIYQTNVVRPLITRMERMFEARAAAGHFRSLDPRLTTRVVGGMVIGLMLLGLLEGEDGPIRTVSHRRLAEEAARLVMQGVGNGPATADRRVDNGQ